MTAYPHALPSNLKDSEHDHSNRFVFFFQAGKIGKSQGDGFAECFLSELFGSSRRRELCLWYAVADSLGGTSDLFLPGQPLDCLLIPIPTLPGSSVQRFLKLPLARRIFGG